MKNFIFQIVLSLFVATNAFAEGITLNTSISAPYQILIGDQLSGTSVKTLGCIFKKINTPYEIQVVPWKRAQYNVKSNKAEGFFTSMSFAEADEYAMLSAPMALEKWYFYYKDNKLLGEQSNKKNMKFGVIRGSNQTAWLAANGFEHFHEVDQYNQLIKLLNSGRVDSILADQTTFEEEASKLNLDMSQFVFEFCKYTPLGVYFSKKFLKEQPGFLESFNNNIFICAPKVAQLNENEMQRLENIANNKIAAWSNHSLLITVIQAQNNKHQSLSPSDILQLDKQWRKEIKSPESPLIDEILNNQLSQYLRKIKTESNGLYTEIFVMDNKGLNVGQSDITSDYWQGDEAKFQKTFEVGQKAIFIGDIQYDESSKKFQTQISLTIDEPTTGTHLGALTVGIDLENALKR